MKGDETNEELQYLYRGITVGDLVKLLSELPQDAKVFYRDGNFGGPDDEFTRSNVSLFKENVVLIDSPYWQAVD